MIEYKKIDFKTKKKYVLFSEEDADKVMDLLSLLNDKDLRISDLEKARRIANEFLSPN